MQRLWFVKGSWVVLVSVLVALMAAAACGGDDTAKAPAIDTDELSALVAAAVKDATPDVPDAITAEEISALVETAIAAAIPEGASAEEIAALVEGAVSAATAGGVTAEDVEALVTAAVSEAAAAGSSALTASEVSDIVTAALAEQAAAADKSKGKVVLVQQLYDAGYMENYIVETILRDEMGYDVERVVLTGLTYWTALCTGSADVSVEMYTANRPAHVLEFITEKQCVEATTPMGQVISQGWYVPNYVIEGDAARGIEAAAPDLVDWEQMEQYKDVFATVETAPKGQILAMDIGWGQQPERLVGTGLDDDYVVIHGGGEVAMLAELNAAVTRGDPIMVYGYTPHYMQRKFDLTPINLPTWFTDCESTTFACQAPDDPLVTGLSASLKDRLPEVHQFFNNWNISNGDMSQMLTDYDSGASYAESAQRWMDRNRAKWQAWIP